MDLDALVAGLARAATTARRLAGRAPLGVRAVEAAPGPPMYLVAFDGPAFLCLDAEGEPVGSARVVHEVAAAVLLCERAEEEVVVDRLHQLATACGTLIVTGVDGPGVDEALQDLAERALRLAAWAAAPERALASVPGLDRGIALHRALQTAHGRFVAATDPLAAEQERLPWALVDALRQIEAAAAAAGAAAPLADRLGAWMADCDEGARDIVERHLRPLRNGPR